MSQDETSRSGLAFAKYIPPHFEAPGLVDDLFLVEVSQEGLILRVVFDGRATVREGRFGVRIPTPARVGDERWMDFPVTGDDMDERANMAVILDLVEIYDTTAQSCANPADADGIVWLS